MWCRKILLVIAMLMVARVGWGQELTTYDASLTKDKVKLNKDKVRFDAFGDGSYFELESPVKTTLTEKDGKYEQSLGDIKVTAYEINKDNFEYEIVFAKKPLSNIYSLNINTEGYHFYYQDTLESDYANGLDVADGETLEHYLSMRERPDNVIGSYAVYHASKRNNEYKTGKAFHIYRPELIDADKKRAWCDMSIADGKLTITMPQKFLDKAKYPVILDPTFGQTSLGGSLIRPLNDIINGTRATAATSSAGTMVTVHHGGNHDGIGKDGYSTLAVYTDDSGDPDALVSTSNEITWTSSDVDTQWKTANISGSVSSGVTYWVTIMVEGDGDNDVGIAYDGNGSSFYGGSGNYPTFPDPLGSHTNSTNLRSIYVTYEEGGGPPTYSGTGVIFMGDPILQDVIIR